MRDIVDVVKRKMEDQLLPIDIHYNKLLGEDQRVYSPSESMRTSWIYTN